MLIKRLEIKNCRKIRQADIEFHGPGLQIIQGMNQSGKTTIAQSIALTMEGPKAFTSGMITTGEEQAEIIAYLAGEQELKIRTVIGGSVKQTVSRKDKATGNYTAVSGGVRAFLDSIRSGLEMPWTMRDMTDARIIEALKERTGITAKITAIDAAIKDKEAVRTEVGRDKNKIGDPARREPKRADQIKQPDPIDDIKAERQKAADQIAWRKAQFEDANEYLRKHCVFQTLEELQAYKKLVDEAEIGMMSVLASREAREQKVYTPVDVDAFDKQLSAWIELKQKADAYAKYRADKAEWDRLTTQYDTLTHEIETLREQRKKTLSGMDLKVKGLEIGEDNMLYHNGVVRGITETNRVGNWSTAENVKVFFSLGARFSGDLKMLVVDNAESLDEKTTKSISDWAETAQFLVILLKVASIPEEREEGIIYLKEGEVLTK
jgi:DNA repair exonuclease SbcCD ATPase subunit